MLCRDIINGSLRKIGKLGAGREPRLADQTDALAALQGLYRQWINQGTFGRLSDVIPTADYTARPNERIFRNSAAVVAITLPETVASYTWLCDACDWAPQTNLLELESGGAVTVSTPASSGVTPPPDCSVVVISDAFSGTTVEFIYDGQTKRWMAIDALTLDTEAPLAHRDPEGLKAYLAMQIVDEFGGTAGPSTMAMAAGFLSSLTQRFSGPVYSQAGVYM